MHTLGSSYTEIHLNKYTDLYKSSLIAAVPLVKSPLTQAKIAPIQCLYCANFPHCKQRFSTVGVHQVSNLVQTNPARKPERKRCAVFFRSVHNCQVLQGVQEASAGVSKRGKLSSEAAKAIFCLLRKSAAFNLNLSRKKLTWH